MAVLKFRIYFQEDESIYRDVVIKHHQHFFDLHQVILKAYDFDNKHAATFYRSNEFWVQGREISLEVYNKTYKAPPLLMQDTVISSEIKDTNQRFIYLYDFVKNWIFHIELINITKEESSKIIYPAVSRKEGIGPQQYGTRSLLGPKFTEIEEKYDLQEGVDGFGQEGEEGTAAETDEESTDAEYGSDEI